MTKTFTHDDLIRFVYEETTFEENQQLEKALACNPNLLDQYQELLWLKTQLDGSMISPSEKTIDSILNFSKQYNLHPIKE